MDVSLDDFRARLAAEEGAEVAWLRTRRGAADRRDLAVVRADVPRTHWHRMAAQSAAERAGHADRLYRLIVDFLEIHPHTRYVQGFHALAEVALLLLGDDAPLLLHRMYRLGHVRPFVGADDIPFRELGEYTLALVALEDADLASLLRAHPLSALLFSPWHLSLFMYCLDSLADAYVLLEYATAQPPYAVLYISAAVLLLNGAQLRSLSSAGGDFEALSRAVSRLPASTDVRLLMARSDALLSRHSPHNVPSPGAHAVLRAFGYRRGERWPWALAAAAVLLGAVLVALLRHDLSGAIVSDPSCLGSGCL